jgi:AcrR family transcriptional regulator
MQRKDAILLAAGDHFGRFGFRGASLRDIARDAGVSLTLLNHHFGCKSALLAAVVGAHGRRLQERIAVLRRLARATSGTTPSDPVRAWIGAAFDTAAHPDGLQFLRLLARLNDSPVEEGAEGIREALDQAAGPFIDALQECRPDAPRHAAAAAWLCVNACLLKMHSGSAPLVDAAGAVPARPPSSQRAWLEGFLAAGIEAALAHPQPAEDGAADPDATDAPARMPLFAGPVPRAAADCS